MAKDLDWSDLESDIWTTGSDATQPETTTTGHKETCPKCNGTGTFVSYSGRVLGECFTCNGKGHKVYKQSAAKRRANREAVAKRTQNKRADNFEAVRQEYPAEVEYLEQNLGHEFTNSLYEYAHKKGCLTEGQLGAIRRGMLREETRAAERAARTADVQNLGPLLEAFQKASDAGLKRPTLRVAGYVFSKAPATGQNAGHLYVKNDGEYLGKISPDGVFMYGHSVDSETVTEVVTIASDLLEATTAHGKRTGQCSCCGRELTNADSIEAGIGPVCAEKWGL
jgi:hypothetical protein